MISTAEIRATSTYFRGSIRTGLQYFEESDDDMMNHHILDCIGALIYTQNIEKCKRKVRRKNEDCIITASKRRVFWQTVQQIAAVQLAGGANAALSSLLDVFPDASSYQTDDRSWMPLHWAVSLPNTDIQDIETLITAQPEAVSTLTRSSGYNPVHLACMANARVEVLHLLQAHFPLWGESVTQFNRFTPLHLAVKYSSSPALVRELARLYPAALDMRDRSYNLPLHYIQTESINGPQILQVLLDAAPHTARALGGGNFLPLHRLLQRCDEDSFVAPEMVSILLAAYPGAVDSEVYGGRLPIHFAAAHAPVQVFQMIAEATNNLANLTAVDHSGYCVAHVAVQHQKIGNLRYIHSVMPELLLEKDHEGCSMISFLDYEELSSPMSACSEILRFLLHHYHRTIIRETDHDKGGGDPFGYKALYEELRFHECVEDDLDLSYPRRLLLLAGHASLCLPEVLRDLNYSARRGALLLFYHHHPPPPAAGTTAVAGTRRDAADNIFWWIRNGPGSEELIRAIVGYL